MHLFLCSPLMNEQQWALFFSLRMTGNLLYIILFSIHMYTFSERINILCRFYIIHSLKRSKKRGEVIREGIQWHPLCFLQKFSDKDLFSPILMGIKILIFWWHSPFSFHSVCFSDIRVTKLMCISFKQSDIYNS